MTTVHAPPLTELLTHVEQLKLRMMSAEERISHLEDAKVELLDSVARLERIELHRQRIEISELEQG